MTAQPSLPARSPAAGRRGSLRSWLIAAVLWVIAVAAAVIAVPYAFTGKSADVSGLEPLAPGLAALSDDQLADLLPERRGFPAGWTVKETDQNLKYFGYSTAQPSGRGLGFAPGECFGVLAGVSTGDTAAAEVSGHDPADPAVFSDRQDVRLRIGREYNPAGFDEMTALVSRCLRFTLSPGARLQFGYTVRILEDAQPAEGLQLFRYSVTTQVGVPGKPTRAATDYFSYARVADLILSGAGSDDHQQVFDAAFAGTLGRIRAAGN